ncbi:MAG TPA: o-succinylbenzoate synthase [Streptosporangiaceae bacterium]|nr:o-succinylbenzoate synthase [Streptosporangiaceae bacterium]
MPVTDTSAAGFLGRARAVEAPVTLARAGVFMLSLPQIRTFRSAYGRSSGRKRLIVVRLEDADGVTGWGEAPVSERPLYGADTAESTWSALTGLLLPPLLGASFRGPAQVAATWADLIGQHYAKNAVETAAWAIASARLGVPLARLWGGGGAAEAVPAGESFPICDTIDALLSEVSARVAEGFGRIKLKIAPGWDVAPARAMRQAFPGLPVSVDANCGYAPGSPVFAELDELGLIMIEQPLAGDALLEMAGLQRSLRTPLCLDESASSVNTTRTALALGAGQIVNIKPPRLGGILPAIAVHDLCAEQQVPVWCGGMLETGIGRGFNLALAALPGFTLHSDMSPARMFYARDLVDPTFDIRPDGLIAVPGRPGNGFPVVPERVADATIRSWDSDRRTSAAP